MKKLLLSFMIVAGMAFGTLGVPTAVSAQSPTDSAKQQACTGISGQVSGASCDGTSNDLSSIVKAVLNILSVVAGVAAVIMIIIGGMKYITSGGDAQAVSGAKRTLIYAVVGLIVVSLSQFIVFFVLKNATR